MAPAECNSILSIRRRVISDSTGSYTEIPVILTSTGLFLPLVDYCLAHSHDRSPAWMSKVNRSVRLFLSYLLVNPNEKDSYLLFQNFAQRLYTGSFDRETGLDPSWLCWRPMSSSEAGKVIIHLTDFFDWLNEKRHSSAKVNPRFVGTAYDRMIDEAAYQFRRDRALFGHTWGPSLTHSKGHFLRSRRDPKVEEPEPPAFPDDRFIQLLHEGFVVAGRPSYRDILITLLCHGAGFRYSEPFHLYLSDVREDPIYKGRALVEIHHPSDGEAPSDKRWLDERGRQKTGNRRAYLAELYGLAPRNLLLNSKAAGYKGGTHDGKWFKRAYWFIPEFGDLFLTLWYRYLEQVARLERPHPFTWINLDQEPRGEMYCLSQYAKKHAQACQRIGLVVGKELGTTPHGHRHAYGRRLVGGMMTPEEIRRCMHHASLESQQVYTTPTSRQIIEALKEGAERLRQRYRRDV